MRKTFLTLMIMLIAILSKAQPTFPLSVGGGINNTGNTNLNFEIGIATHYPTTYPTLAFQYSKNKKTGYFEYLVGGKIHHMFNSGDNVRQSVSIGVFKFSTENYTQTDIFEINGEKEIYTSPALTHAVIQLGYRFMYNISEYYQTPAYLSFAPNVNIWPKASIQLNVAWVVMLAPKKRGCCSNNVMIN